MNTYRSRAADQRVAEDFTASQDLMCAAQGCPHRWSVDAGSGRLCSFHAWSPAHMWPQITQERLDAMADRAHRKQFEKPPVVKPMSRTEKTRILRALLDFVPAPVGKRDWAHKLVRRAEAGERMSPLVLKLAQAVVGRKAA